MVTGQQISEFLSERRLALVGASRNGKKFGNAVLRELRARGYQVYPVHPEAPEIEGQPCWPSVTRLPEKVGGVVLVIPPAATAEVVREAIDAGIPRVWMQQGSESAAAVSYCEQRAIPVVHGHCLLMFLEPAAFVHRAHRWIWDLFGKLPR